MRHNKPEKTSANKALLKIGVPAKGTGWNCHLGEMSQNLSIYDCCRLKDKSAFGVVDTAYDGLIYRQAQADSLATALRCWSSRLCA